MLKFEDVSFSYLNQPVLDGLDFHVKEGEFVFLIGKSGCGKTTLLQMIYMNLLPQTGKVIFNGFDSSSVKKRDLPLLRRKIGIVFQDFRLLEDRSVYDNLAFVLQVTGTKKKEIKKKVYHVLSEMGLSHKQQNMPHQLSGGEKQRIAIARAILNDPLLLLADEPTGNLDPETQNEIVNTLSKINKSGTAVLFATHNYGLVKMADSRIMKLDSGKVAQVTLKKTSSN